jgi:hypothetical protein
MSQTISLSSLDWMIDSWISENNESGETWSKKTENEYTGEGWQLQNGERKIFEKLSLVSKNDGIYYVADVSHNEKPVCFKLTKSDTNKAVFENPEHDFPDIITYELISPDILTAVIEGRNKKIEFRFTLTR